MMEIAVHGPQQIGTPLAILDDCTDCRVKEHMQGAYELSLSYPLRSAGAEHLRPFYQIVAGGQTYRIFHVEKDDAAYPRKASHMMHVLARHIFYDLSHYVIDTLLVEDASCEETMAAILEHVGLTGTFSVTGMAGTPRTIPFEQMTAAEAMLMIAKEWGGILLRDTYQITIASPESSTGTIQVAYGRNLMGIRELDSADEVVTRVYPIGADDLLLPEGYLTHSSWNSAEYPGFPLSRILSFPDANTEEELRQLAQDYLEAHAVSDKNYQIDCILLNQQAEELGYATYDDLLHVNVGDAAQVVHEPLGLSLQRQVISVDRDLLLAINTRVELGRPVYALNDYLEDLRASIKQSVNPLQDEQRAQRWAGTVLAYVEGVLGGSVRNVNPRLLLYTPATLHFGVHRKLLVDVCSILLQITPEWEGPEDSRRFRVDDPVGAIKQQRVRVISQAYSIIDRYIKDSVGFVSGNNLLVNRINNAYANTYGQGQIASQPDDTMETVFPSEWEVGSDEYYYANLCLNTVQSYIGNLSELYLEIGGGGSGAVGAINEVYRLLAEPKTQHSADEPDPSLGKDGDLWQRFTPSELADRPGQFELYRKEEGEYLPYRPETSMHISPFPPDPSVGLEADVWHQFIPPEEEGTPGRLETYHKEHGEYLPYRPDTGITLSTEMPSPLVGLDGDAWLRFQEPASEGESGYVETYRRVGGEFKLYLARTKPGITVSDAAPDDSVGEDGDLWFQFEE